MNADRKVIVAAPAPRPKSAVPMGRPIAITDPNASSRITIATSSPTPSALDGGVRSAARRDVAAELDLQAGVDRGRGRRLQLAVGATGKAVRVGVVAHGGEGDRVVRRGPQRGTRGRHHHVIEPGDRVERARHRGGVVGIGEGAVGRVEHDLGRPARLGRERCPEEVGRLLGLDTGHGERVLQLAAGHLPDDEQPHDGDHPGRHDPSAVPGREAAEAVQEPRHGCEASVTSRS